MKRNLLNSNVGLVTKVFGQQVELRLPKGGRVSAPNRGFEVGEAVCFTLDASGCNIVNIYPKDVADLKVALAQEPMLQSAIMEDYDDSIETDITGGGQETEGSPDSCGGIHRGGLDIGEGDPYDPIDYEDRDGDDYLDKGDPEPSGETIDNEFYLFLESGNLSELAEDDSPFA